MAPKDRMHLPFRWRFVPVPDAADRSIHWLWRAYTQTGEVAVESQRVFETLTECMDDAKANGFGEPQRW